MRPEIDATATARLCEWASDRIANGDFGAVARRLGAIAIPGGTATGTVEFGLWAPSLREGTADRIELEMSLPPAGFDPTIERQTIDVERHRFEMAAVGETAWIVLAGVPVGTRDRVGASYRFRGVGSGDEILVLPDPMGMSFPFGAFAPAEVVDLTGERADAGYFRSEVAGDGVPRQGPPVNVLQVHPRSATEEGTLAALARRITAASERVVSGTEEAGDRIWMAYDSIELLPIEPLIGFEGDEGYWVEAGSNGNEVSVTVGRPDMHNWGYDIPICGSGTVTPTVLETGRPHELIDFVAALHTLPTGPIRVIFDIVYGHADNQAVGLMPPAWFTGPDMYGQHLDYLNPFVRAQLLEMQRRKADFGVDGLRVDGAQDFTYWSHEEGDLIRDDEFMKEMSDVVQDVAGVSYRPWMIFEDGRPWPRADWELASTYRAVTDLQPHVFQWGPLTFAHNTPFLFTFWVSKWWRLREVAEVGSRWISGCANHDTLRRGSQVDPAQRINTFLGDSLPEVIARAYDHPASTLLFHCFLPGVPMDFLQGITRTPWSFIRDTDRRYALKVWGEEARFLDWRVTADDYAEPKNFPRLKALGFSDRSSIVAFMENLSAAVEVYGDAVDPVIAAVERGPRPDALGTDLDSLVAAARAWMRDVHDFCTVTSGRVASLDAGIVHFDHQARSFRRQHPWLLGDLDDADRFEYVHPTDGAVLFNGLRTDPYSGTQVLFVANMEGVPKAVVPVDLVGVDPDRWRLAVVAPGLAYGASHATTIPRLQSETIVERPETGGAGGEPPTSAAAEITLTDGTGAIWVRRP
jgi:hypothetical protein